MASDFRLKNLKSELVYGFSRMYNYVEVRAIRTPYELVMSVKYFIYRRDVRIVPFWLFERFKTKISSSTIMYHFVEGLIPQEILDQSCIRLN